MRRRWRWFGFALLLAAVCALGIVQLQLGHGYRQFIDRDDSALAVSDAITAEVASGRDTLTLIYRPASGQMFESTSMLQLAKLADLVSRLEHVTSPQSLVSAHKLVRVADAPPGAAPSDAYRVVPLIHPDGLFDDAGLARLRRDVATMPTVQGRLVARDGTSAAVVIPFDLGPDAAERTRRLAALQAAVDTLQADLRGLRAGDALVLTGPAMFEFAVQRSLVRDLQVLAPTSTVLFFALLLFLFRSFASACIVMLVVGVSCGTTLGAVAWVGLPATILVFSGLILVSTLSIAEALHVMTTANLARVEGMEAGAAMEHSLDLNLWAIVTTSATTFIGEAVLLFSSSPAIRNMGIVMMVGAFFALFFTLTLVPALSSLQKRVRRGWVSGLGGRFDRLAAYCTEHPRQVLAAFALLCAVLLPGLAQLRSFDTMAGWFAGRTEFRQGLDLLDANYVALGALDVITRVDNADREAVAAWPAPQPAIERQINFDQALAALPGVRTTITPSSAQRAFEQQSAQPDTALRLSAEVIKEAPSSSPPGLSALEKAHLMTASGSGRDVWLARTLDAGTAGNERMVALGQQVEKQAAMLGERQTLVGGLPFVFATLGQSNMGSTLQGTLLTVAAITVCLGIALGSVRGGLLSMLPNVLPVALVFGAWGLLSGEVNLAATTVVSLALGIVVDDTTHIMMKHRRFVAAGHSPAEASRLTIVHGGPSIIVSTIILAVGFVVLGYSDFALTSQQALMIAACICVAVVFDLTVTPVLLSMGGGKRE